MAVSSVETDIPRMADGTTDVIEIEAPPEVDGEKIFKEAIKQKARNRTVVTDISDDREELRGRWELGELASGRTFRWMVDKIKGFFYTPTPEEIHNH